MSKNRNSQTASVRFGAVIRVCCLCLLVGASAIGFVWQKSEIGQLGKQISQREAKLRQLQVDNSRMTEAIGRLREPVMLDQRVRELNLGLVPAQPGQKIWLAEPAPAPVRSGVRQFAQRPAADEPH